MAKIFNIDEAKQLSELVRILQKAVQSANLNFILGSGCSYPAIQTLADVEKSVEDLISQGKNDEAEEIILDFLEPFVASTKQLYDDDLDDDHEKVLQNYEAFLETLSHILFERKSNIVNKQANIFTTNYDLFLEYAHESYEETLNLNDGFNRTPSLRKSYIYSPHMFFNSIQNTGNLYRYKVEVPSLNLIKLHGSINWRAKDNEIVQMLQSSLTKAKEIIDDNYIKYSFDDFYKLFALILPKKDKFAETLLNRIYYDLLRIYQNELDKENTLLIAEGFSFADEHIFDLTKRALKNPTLRLIIFCFDKDEELKIFEERFSQFSNVNIVCSDEENIDFAKFIEIFQGILPEQTDNENEDVGTGDDDE